MHRMNMKRAISTVVLVASLLLLASSHNRITVAHAQSPCGEVPNPSGVYGFAVEGLNDGGQQGAFTIGSFYPLSAAGTFTFMPSRPGSSSGTASRYFFLNFGGAVSSTPVKDSGPYSQNPDCTFSATFTDAGEVWNLVTVDEAKQVKFFVNAAGSVVAGTMTRQ
jgi:hypothetical protein